MAEALKTLGLLFFLRRRQLLRGLKKFKKIRIKFLIPLFLAAIFMGLIFLGFFRTAGYIKSAPLVGSAILFRLLATIFTALMVLLFYSSVITAFSTLYFNKENNYVFTIPLHRGILIIERLIKNTFISGWMSMLVFIPVLAGLGFNYSIPLKGYLFIFFNFGLFLIIISGAGMTAAAASVRVFPARKASNFMTAGLVVIGTVLYMVLRTLNIEELLRPEKGALAVEYLDMLRIPRAPYLPSYWMGNTVISWARGGEGWLHPTVALLLFAAFWVIIYYLVLKSSFFFGWEKVKSQEKKRYVKKRFPSEPVLRKDIRVFFRDTRQWVQLFLTGALVAIYLFNIYKLPLDLEGALPAVVILNSSMIIFLAAAVGLRFSFCSISLEGENFWILQTSPVQLKKLVRSKFLMNLIPVEIMAGLLIIFSNLILNVPPLVNILSTAAVLIAASSLSCLAMGMGCIYPRFKASGPAEIETSWGGFIYMVIAFFYGASFSALAVFGLRRQMIPENIAAAAGLGVLFILISIGVGFIPLLAGVKKLARIEIEG